MAQTGVILALAAILTGGRAASESAESAAKEAANSNLCGERGFLSAELFGALETSLQWAAANLECEGMKRPDGNGVRLRRKGRRSGPRHDLSRGETGREYQSNVTLIEEGKGRFFSTADIDICWTDVLGLESIGDSESNFAIGGNLYCVAPLTEINGDSDVLIREMKFRGLLDWNAS